MKIFNMKKRIFAVIVVALISLAVIGVVIYLIHLNDNGETEINENNNENTGKNEEIEGPASELPEIVLFDNFNKNVRGIPKVLEFGGARIEMACSYENDGINIFQMAVYIKNNDNTIMSFEDYNDFIGEYKSLEITFSDGTSVILEGQSVGVNSKGGSAFSDATDVVCYYQYKDFPREYSFTVKTAENNINTDITLRPINENLNITITDDGIKRIGMIPAAEGSRLFIYHIEILKPSLAENMAMGVSYMILPHYNFSDIENDVFFKDGTILSWSQDSINYYGGFPIFVVDDAAEKSFKLFDRQYYKYHSWGEYSIYSSDFPDSEIDKISINDLGVSLSFSDVLRDSNYLPITDIKFEDVINGIYTQAEYQNSWTREIIEQAKVKIPAPKDGERIYYDEPVKIAEIGEFTISFDTVQRFEDFLIIFTNKNTLTYSGSEDILFPSFSLYAPDYPSLEENQAIHMAIRNALDMDEYGICVIRLPKDYTEDTFETHVESISYYVKSNWETIFIND